MQGKYWVCLTICRVSIGYVYFFFGAAFFAGFFATFLAGAFLAGAFLAGAFFLGAAFFLAGALALGLAGALAFLALGFLALAGLALGSLAGSLKDPAPFLPAAAAATIALEVTSFLRAILTRPPALAASTL